MTISSPLTVRRVLVLLTNDILGLMCIAAMGFAHWKLIVSYICFLSVMTANDGEINSYYPSVTLCNAPGLRPSSLYLAVVIICLTHMLTTHCSHQCSIDPRVAETAPP